MSKSTPSGKSIAGVGIDIGNSKCVIAIANSHGVAEALLNEQGSKRETPTVVHFGANQRLFGALGASKAEISPSTTFSELKRFVNCHLDPTQLTGLPYNTSRDSNGNITVEVTYHNKKRKFTAVEMLGMLLSHLKKTAETAAEGRISDCVMAVPAYFSREQKTAYLNAAKIAGFKPLGLLHEGVAAAVEYGNARPEGAANSCVVFVDVGHSDTQMTVVRFDGKQRRVLGQAHDSSLGGRDFDDILFEFFLEKFKREYKIDANSDERARVRLRLACEKAKLQLSANKEVDVKVHSLKDGVDVKGAITRAKFESNSRELLKRIGELFSKALANANLGKDQIDSVEMVGSGWRIPAISSTLTEIFGRNVSTTLKGAECTARGCAIFCRMMTGYRSHNVEDDDRKKLGFANEEFTPATIAKDDISDAKAREQKFAEKDFYTEHALAERNALESYIYDTRNEFKKFPAGEYQDINDALNKAEEWLSKDGDAVRSKEDYNNKLQSLRESIISMKNHHQAKDRHVLQSNSCPPDARTSQAPQGQLAPGSLNEEFRRARMADDDARQRNDFDSYISNTISKFQQLKSGKTVFLAARNNTFMNLSLGTSKEMNQGSKHKRVDHVKTTNEKQKLTRKENLLGFVRRPFERFGREVDNLIALVPHGGKREDKPSTSTDEHDDVDGRRNEQRKGRPPKGSNPDLEGQSQNQNLPSARVIQDHPRQNGEDGRYFVKGHERNIDQYLDVTMHDPSRTTGERSEVENVAQINKDRGKQTEGFRQLP